MFTRNRNHAYISRSHRAGSGSASPSGATARPRRVCAGADPLTLNLHYDAKNHYSNATLLPRCASDSRMHKVVSIGIPVCYVTKLALSFTSAR